MSTFELLLIRALWNESTSCVTEVTNDPYCTSIVLVVPTLIFELAIVVLSIVPLSILIFVIGWLLKSEDPVNLKEDIFWTVNSLDIGL